jgi:transcriptional regulator with XRE-family HTH domain
MRLTIKTVLKSGSKATAKRRLSRAANPDNLPSNRLGARAVGIYPDMNRTELARRVGMSVAMVSKYLSGRSGIRLGMAVKLAREIGVEVGELERELRKVSRSGARTTSP